MKKAIVVYDSKFGNTEKVAKALASGMEGEGEGVEVDCVKVEDVEIYRLTGYDLVAVGGPTQMFRMSGPVKSFLQRLEGVGMIGKKAFAFDTKLRSRFAGSAANGIEKRLRRLGMSIVRPHASAIVKGSEGPLEEGAEDMFRQIGAGIARSK